MLISDIIKGHEYSYIEARKSGKPFTERKLHLDIISLAERYKKAPYKISTTQELIEDLHKRTDKLLEEHTFLYDRNTNT